MPELIEPESPAEAAEQVAALQDVPAEDEDVQAHIGLSVDPNSTISVGSYCDITT